MIAVRIPDTRRFLSDLLSRSTFDTFVLGEAQLTTFTTFRIDGTWHPDYFLSMEERQKSHAEEGSFAGSGNQLVQPVLKNESDQPDSQSLPGEEPSWMRMRIYVASIVRGSHTPISFRIVLKMARKSIESVIRHSGVSFSADQVDGLFLNIVFQHGEVTCTSGTSMKTFTLDKSLDHAWDDMVLKFFAAKNIEAEKL